MQLLWRTNNLVSVLTESIFFFSWQSNERLNRHIGFNVIFAAVYYDVLLVFHDVNILLVYM